MDHVNERDKELLKKIFEPPKVYKPFFTGYTPQFYFRTTNTRDISLPVSREMMLLYNQSTH